MPLWHLLGLLAWVTVCYQRWPDFSGTSLALLLFLTTALYVAVSGLRRVSLFLPQPK